MISIIVPTYNESGNIPKLVLELYKNLNKVGEKFEIIIVDDNSPDKTWEIAGKYSKYHVKVIRRTKDKGLGSAVIEGFRQAKGSVLGVMDADLSHPPKLLPKMFDAIKGNDVVKGKDIVIASRHIVGGEAKFSLYRRIVSLGAKMLSWPLTAVKDPMSGYFMIRKNVLNGASLRPRGYKILLEILVKGTYDVKKVVEMPLVFEKRLNGESKLGLKVYFDYILHVFSLYIYKLFH